MATLDYHEIPVDRRKKFGKAEKKAEVRDQRSGIRGQRSEVATQTIQIDVGLAPAPPSSVRVNTLISDL
jgi:hypothetical protein